VENNKRKTIVKICNEQRLIEYQVNNDWVIKRFRRSNMKIEYICTTERTFYMGNHQGKKE